MDTTTENTERTENGRDSGHSQPSLVGLVWKKRVPKYKRAIAMQALRKCYPDAEDNGVSVRFTARDTGYVMIFMLSKVFSEFEPNAQDHDRGTAQP